MVSIVIASVVSGCSESDEWKDEILRSPPVIEESNKVHNIDLTVRSFRYIDKKDKRITYGDSYLRIYHGEYGNKLEKFKEFEDTSIENIDYLEVEWLDDNVALIYVHRVAEDGTRFKDETLRLDTSI